MRYLDLNIITAEHLYGAWDVLEQPAGQTDDATVFSSCSRILLQEGGTVQIQCDTTQTGRWELFKEEEIIYNPQLRFNFTNEPEELTAVITRFREDQEEGYLSQKVTLYFTSGLELVLEQKQPK